MQIRADVVDISSDTPGSTDTFLVDTNVWFWFTYTRASLGRKPPRPWQQKKYPRYLKAALRRRATILHHDLMFSELAHNIERTEAEIHTSAGNGATGTPGTSPAPLRIKQFRQDPPLRANVLSEIEAAWSQISSMSRPLSWTITTGCASRLLDELRASCLDAYDAAYTLDLRAAGLTNVLTDDSDFASVSGIRVFTVNRRLLDEARRTGKLITR